MVTIDEDGKLEYDYVKQILAKCRYPFLVFNKSPSSHQRLQRGPIKKEEKKNRITAGGMRYVQGVSERIEV